MNYVFQALEVTLDKLTGRERKRSLGFFNDPEKAVAEIKRRKNRHFVRVRHPEGYPTYSVRKVAVY